MSVGLRLAAPPVRCREPPFEVGFACGPNAVTGTSTNALTSSDPNTPNYLFPAGPALGAAMVQTGVEIDDLGGLRMGAADIGAIEP